MQIYLLSILYLTDLSISHVLLVVVTVLLSGIWFVLWSFGITLLACVLVLWLLVSLIAPSSQNGSWFHWSSRVLKVDMILCGCFTILYSIVYHVCAIWSFQDIWAWFCTFWEYSNLLPVFVLKCYWLPWYKLWLIIGCFVFVSRHDDLEAIVKVQDK